MYEDIDERLEQPTAYFQVYPRSNYFSRTRDFFNFFGHDAAIGSSSVMSPSTRGKTNALLEHPDLPILGIYDQFSGIPTV